MTAKEMAKAYEPKAHEDEIYKKWEDSGFFNPDNLNLPENSPAYTIVLPPPNVTGTLHMGHAAMLALEDTLIRYKRMRENQTLWIPGTDHAAIATQTKVEKILKEEGTDRHKLGREKFLERVKQFSQDSHDTIINQAKKMGASLDWSREAYTLDDVRNKAVNIVFKMMYDDGLIYRGERVINWCPRCHSTLADDEVEYKEQKASLYTFKYSKDFPIAISTTRPETKLGDTAVAVNPKDERYKKYIGQVFEVNFCGIDLKIKIIGDRHVDMDFGTGALGVTPAHSYADWQMAIENDLPIIKVIDEDGEIITDFKEFAGLTAKAAREKIVECLQSNNLIEKEEEIENKLSVCYRCDTPIEPIPSLQWFVDVNKKIKKHDKSIKEISVEAVKSGVFGREKINIIPERFEKNYFNFLDNLRDWCISRQIWFGHQIPVWYKEKEIFVGLEAPEGDGWMRDPDTLDTWFSSGLWTFSTLANSLDQIKLEDGKLIIDSDDFRKFHPNSVLETGYDIIFFWVARMIIMTTYAIGDIPFQDVYLHGLVLDEKGKKMSKSKGNTINPLDMIEQYGTDATRLSLIIGSAPGNDLRLSEEKIAGFRNLVNKIWNIARYAMTNYEINITDIDFDLNKLSSADQWILNKLNNLIKNISDDLENYRFSQAGEALREFTWNDLADWYLEASKFEKTDEKKKVLSYVLANTLKLWHPFTPFITEVIWESLSDDLLLVAKWPEANDNILNNTEKSAEDFELVKNLISSIRNARAENKVDTAKKVKAVIYAHDKKAILESQTDLIKNLKTGIDNLEILESGEKITDAIYVISDGVEIYLIGAVDEAKEQERIAKEIERLNKFITSMKGKLANQEFITNAPENIVKMEQDKLAKAEEELKRLEK